MLVTSMYILSESNQNHSEKPTVTILVTASWDVMPCTLVGCSHDPEPPVPCTPKLFNCRMKQYDTLKRDYTDKIPFGVSFHAEITRLLVLRLYVGMYAWMNAPTEFSFASPSDRKRYIMGKKKITRTRLHDSCTRMYHCTTAYMAAAGFP